MSPLSIVTRALLLTLGGSVMGCALKRSRSTSPRPNDVLNIMERVADWQLAHPSRHDPATWTQCAGYTGFMALAAISPERRFHDAMLRMGQQNEWKLGTEGSPYLADDHCVGQVYAELFLQHGDSAMIAPTRTRFDWILAHPTNDNLRTDRSQNPDAGTGWWWCDALFMAPAAWLRMATATGRQEYLDFMVRHWWQTSDYLYDPGEHLYFRDDRFFTRRERNGRKVFWSRGNGWVMAGLARVLQDLPRDHPSRPRFVRQFREMAERIVTLQQADGFWRASLLDPASYPMRETSGTGFYVYALGWGVNEGLLDPSTFTPTVMKGWRALVSSVHGDGKLMYVQPIGETPVHFDEESTDVYGVGAFLLAGSEVYRLLGGTRSVPNGVSSATPAFRVIAFFTGKQDQAHISFVHEAVRWFPETAAKYNFRFDTTSNWSNLNPDVLSKYEVVVFLDTRPEDPVQRAAFQAYMERGGAWMGFHFAGFALTPSAVPANWDWYHDTFLGSGSYVSNTWRPTSAILRVENRSHPATHRLPATFRSSPNEWYRWGRDLRQDPDIDILLAIDSASFPLGTGPKPHEIWHDGYYPVVWTNRKYRMLYLNMGHNDIDYEHKYDTTNRTLSFTLNNPVEDQLIIDGLLWLGNASGGRVGKRSWPRSSRELSAWGQSRRSCCRTDR